MKPAALIYTEDKKVIEIPVTEEMYDEIMNARANNWGQIVVQLNIWKVKINVDKLLIPN